MTVPMPIADGDLKREVKVSALWSLSAAHSTRLQVAFAFGGTEIRVRAQDVTSGHARSCTVNFLGVERAVAMEDETSSSRKRYARDDDEDTSNSSSAKKQRTQK